MKSSLFRAPGSADLRTARFLQTLAELLDAGLTPARALEQEGLIHLAGAAAAPAAAQLRAGAPLSAALRILDFNDRTIARVEAAEAAGRVPAALRRIAGERIRKAEMIRRAVAKLLYPMFLIHLAALAKGILVFVKLGFGGALVEALTIALPFDAALFLFVYLLKDASQGGKSFRFLNSLPFAGTLLRDLSLAPFLWSLADLYDSGMPLDKAVNSAARGSNIQFTKAMAGVAAQVSGGNPLLPAIVRSKTFDDTTIAVLQPAEATGTLGEALPRAAAVVESRLNRSLHFTSNAPGVLLYGCAILLIATIVFNFYSDYFGAVFKQL